MITLLSVNRVWHRWSTELSGCNSAASGVEASAQSVNIKGETTRPL